MKCLFFSVLLFTGLIVDAQNLQIHYDFRHTIDPKVNFQNFPTVYFEYYKMLDSGKAFIKPAGFFFKTQADYNGLQHNISNNYFQASQEFKFGTSKILLALQYGGGLGVTDPKQYSYYIANTYSAGLSYHYNIGGTILSSVLFYRFVPYKISSHDAAYTMYAYKPLFNYKVEVLSDMTLWTENKNHGDDATVGLKCKRFFAYGEVQGFYNLNKLIGIGTKVNIFYHVLFPENKVNVYPVMALKIKFNSTKEPF